MLGGAGGVCNVFFAHCNLQCVYCQNYQISCNSVPLARYRTSVESLVAQVEAILEQGCSTLGFVSATPYAPYIPSIVGMLREHGYAPTVVYNTNGYDGCEALGLLEGFVDIYLPDYKYGSYSVAQELSGARDYPDYALEAIGAMVEQVGKALRLDESGVATRGVLVRHLVLPGRLENSQAALLNLWSEFGREIQLSIMGQYGPAHLSGEYAELGRGLTAGEYEAVLREFDMLGFAGGFMQELSSSTHYRPDFEREDVFEAEG